MEWIGSILFFLAVGLSGAKIADDFGDRGLRGYGMLMILIAIYAMAIGIGFS